MKILSACCSNAKRHAPCAMRFYDEGRGSMRITIAEIAEMKRRSEKIPMLTAYDYATGKIADDTGVPMILVGDSLGMVVLGYESTIPVTLEEMLHHTRAVARAAKRALIVG